MTRRKPVLFTVEHLLDFGLCIVIPVINRKPSPHCEYMMFPEEVQGFVALYNKNPAACEFAYRVKEEMMQ